MSTNTPNCEIYNIPAGTYYVGDPCYVFDGHDWNDLLNKCSYFDEHKLHDYKGKPIAAFSTAGGDGCYGGLPVDSGMIGFVHVDLITPEKMKEVVASNYGLIKVFDELWSAYTEDSGLICIGGVVIMTGHESEWDSSGESEWDSSGDGDDESEWDSSGESE